MPEYAKRNISLPPDIAARVEEIANKTGLPVSTLIAELLGMLICLEPISFSWVAPEYRTAKLEMGRLSLDYERNAETRKYHLIRLYVNGNLTPIEE